MIYENGLEESVARLKEEHPDETLEIESRAFERGQENLIKRVIGVYNKAVEDVKSASGEAANTAIIEAYKRGYERGKREAAQGGCTE